MYKAFEVVKKMFSNTFVTNIKILPKKDIVIKTLGLLYFTIVSKVNIRTIIYL